ncbi:L-threonylcarbamoyladenylate synthase [Sedimenticola selenatireducens]|jgi:tRNA threonylcarbamoyl adenosine modification protein (Sua5/YciO/YrdC/YwlC family)|uniref:Threonylcarbamoyl-AMP synthase n=1 Tax=Sedimenticola selenatireducens TaxID=191960 RepID=A0A557S7W7_9GAMM|nr:L-threonylcarbamoyladenylate synthase [Sedimenticola selenatireducens]TVO73451.1 threonylcarbamoyl-AMP synthase [Sedimenticola selenatireducens]TVT63392.1 MAG: threonylcarbamoyl-AMP synthase [Sedimenticola selenatireducens]
MAQFFQIHPENPQLRLIRSAVEIIRQGGVVIYPTDSSYALGCHIGDKNAMERIRTIRKLDDKHNFTLVCRDLSEIAVYAKIENQHYRMLKSLTPGPYTFIHKATKQVPRRLQHPKKKTIGIRVPENPIAQALLAELAEPMMSSTLILPGEELPLTDPYEMRDILSHQVDLVIDGGYCGIEDSTVVDMEGDTPFVVRAGKGDTSLFDV